MGAETANARSSLITGLAVAGAVLSLLVLAAHFLRGGHTLLTLALLAAPLLFAARRPWTVGTVQALLALGTLEWLRTLGLLAAARLRSGEPFLRMVLILAAVAAVSALSAVGLSRLRARGPREPAAGPDA